MFDIAIKNCSVLMPDFSVKENQDIYIKDALIAKITDTDADRVRETDKTEAGMCGAKVLGAEGAEGKKPGSYFREGQAGDAGTD